MSLKQTNKQKLIYFEKKRKENSCEWKRKTFGNHANTRHFTRYFYVIFYTDLFLQYRGKKFKIYEEKIIFTWKREKGKKEEKVGKNKERVRNVSTKLNSRIFLLVTFKLKHKIIIPARKFNLKIIIL